MYQRVGLTLIALTSIVVAMPVDAATVMLDATDSGFVTEAGGASKFDGLSPFAPMAANNYSVGYEVHFVDGGGGPGEVDFMHRKNYFVFDLTGVTDPIVDATLFLFNPIDGYESTDPTETYEVGATGSPTALEDMETLATFTSPMDVDATAVALAATLFSELADTLGPLPPDSPAPMKTVLASAEISAASEETTVAVIFTPEGIDYLNLFLGGKVVLAGAVPTIDLSGPMPLTQQPFGFTAPLIGPGSTPTPMLEVTTAIVVPLPVAAWAGVVMLSGMGGVGMIRRRLWTS